MATVTPIAPVSPETRRHVDPGAMSAALALTALYGPEGAAEVTRSCSPGNQLARRVGAALEALS